MAQTKIDEELLRRIDALELDERILAWRKAMRAAPWKLFADRERYTVASWRATEGEDIQIRRAKLVANILDNIDIAILDFDALAGRSTPGVIGACTAIDVCGDYIPDLWKDTSEVNLTLNASAALDEESLEILRESARVFGGKTAPEMADKAWAEVLGTWPKDATDAKVKDPTLDAGIFGQVTSVPMWGKLLSKGLRSYIGEAQGHIDAFIQNRETDIDRLYFWKSAVIVCEAIIKHARRYAALAGELAAAETDPARRTQLLEIAETCMRVPEHPARSFHEALQSMAIVSACKVLEHPMHNNPHWGRGDQYLYPYFIRDITGGRVSLEKASSLLAELIGRWGTQIFVTNETQRESHQINFAINNVLLGGLGQDGEDASNELSYLFLHMVGLLQLSSPTVGVRWNRKTPDWLMRKAIKTNLATKGGIPLFQNDENMIRHYTDDGIPYEEAVEWCGLGCVYPCLPSRAEHYGAEGIAGFNLAAVLHLALHNGRGVTGKLIGLETGDPADFESFDALYDAFKQQHRYVLYRAFWLAAIARNVQHKYMRLPLISTIGLQASMDLGQDVLIPHPDYAMFGISDRAIIDVADALIAVKKLVFDDGKLTMAALMAALNANFDGPRGEEIRRMCLKQPKFGNDIDEVDLLAKDISEFSAGVIKSYDNAPFRPYMIAREGLAWHYYGGLGVGALPNGRKALEPLDDGSISPMRGADTNGPTAVIRSVLKAGFEDSYAHVLNQKFTSSILKSPESLDKLVTYTNAFFKNGGTHIQYNIADKEELLEAKRKPEEHRDLIVRIGGFSAYFVQLSPEIQDDVINRSEHLL
ncbi:formate C-acetyltransferase [Sporobacter termitidis DSM 10068]|uniref:Formate C-acetyltransferase n=1 Tax=Sporobacter termitidis DSM 10068 TaxID=1123282 RepID=A0A1M5Z160_9FIRM|nr:pyruvate formate lyase family protein [Sporobacter termitidis]SHI17808.1 formate C-acetyltransferase [Sporobacter termitidis DSM 10068]